MDLESILSMLTIHMVNDCPIFCVSLVNCLQSVTANPATQLCLGVVSIQRLSEAHTAQNIQGGVGGG